MQTKTPVKWEEKTLSEICTIRPNKQEARNKLKDNELISFVAMEYLGINQKYFASEIDKSLNEVVNSYTYFADNDVLLAKITPCFENGKLGVAQNLTNGIGFGSSEYIVFRPNESLDCNFLYYFLNRESFRQEGAQNMHGAVGHKRVAKEFIENYKIKIPDLKEQQRIVDILDKAFENIEQLTANAKQNLQNAKDLFDSYLEQIFSENSRIWKEKTLNQIGIIQTGTTPKTSEKENFGDYIPFIKPADFYKDGSLNYENEGLSEIGIKKSRLVKEKSVLMVCIGATIGKTGYTEQDITCNQQINTLTPSTDYYKFLYYAMIRKSFQSIIIDGCPQTTLPIINKTNWSNLTIQLPDVEEQIVIANKLDNLKEEIKQLEQIYQQKIEQAEELKQSILQKAFNGEL